MEQLLDYYGFDNFKKDISSCFELITYTHIKDDYFLVIEKTTNTFNVYLTTYDSEKNIGNTKPTGINLLIEDYKIDNNDHRRIIQQYLDYN